MRVQSNYAGFDFENVWTMEGYSGYPYAELTAVPSKYTKYGDANCDTEINMLDAKEVLRHCVHLIDLEEKYGAQALINAGVAINSGNQNKINVLDAATILRYIVKLITEFPVEKE